MKEMKVSPLAKRYQEKAKLREVKCSKCGFLIATRMKIPRCSKCGAYTRDAKKK